MWACSTSCAQTLADSQKLANRSQPKFRGHVDCMYTYVYWPISIRFLMSCSVVEIFSVIVLSCPSSSPCHPLHRFGSRTATGSKSTGNGKLDPMQPPEHLNRSPPNVAYVIMSPISVILQNFIQVGSWVFFGSCVTFRTLSWLGHFVRFLGVLPIAYSQDATPDFDVKYVKGL